MIENRFVRVAICGNKPRDGVVSLAICIDANYAGIVIAVDAFPCAAVRSVKAMNPPHVFKIREKFKSNIRTQTYIKQAHASRSQRAS